MAITIDVGRDFSSTPAGRYPADGPFSGEAFREKCLVPALAKGEKIVVLLDSAEGFGSSFLEEAFGGLIRIHHFTGEELRKWLDFRSEDETLPEEIWSYIDNASND